MNKPKSEYRILVTPNVEVPYDQRMVAGLAEGFEHLNQPCLSMKKPLSSPELKVLCEEANIDLVIQVNRSRDPNFPLPEKVRHIAWYQDVFPNTITDFSEPFKPQDILYALGDKEVLGLNVDLPCYQSSLFTGVDDYLLRVKPKGARDTLDFGLCAGLPAPIVYRQAGTVDLFWKLDQVIKATPVLSSARIYWILRRLFLGGRVPVDYVPFSILKEMEDVVSALYRPLRGDLDIHVLARSLRTMVDKFHETYVPPAPLPKSFSSVRPFEKLFKNYQIKSTGLQGRMFRYIAGQSNYQQTAHADPINSAIDYFCQTFPRIKDRELLIKMAEEVSKDIDIYGPGMQHYQFAQLYFKGVLDTIDDLLMVYNRAKINLSNNTHGLGLHSRTFECLGVGGFMMIHESPHDNTVGGMRSAFEPGVHYGSFTPENFVDEASRWLRNSKERDQVGLNGRKIIENEHRWVYRAQQILDDLKK